MRGKRPASIRKADAEMMLFANSVRSIMGDHIMEANALDNVLEDTIQQRDELAGYQRMDELAALDAVESLPEDRLDEYLQNFAAVGDLRASAIPNLAQMYNEAYDRKDVKQEQLPGRLHLSAVNMAMSNAVRTGKMEGKGFRGKRKPSRASLFDVMEAPARKKR